MLKEGQARSKKLYQNIAGSGFYKAINVVFSFLIVRVSIQVVGEEQYGIWLTLLSFFTWFSALEVGISSSLRNAITLRFSKGDFTSVQPLIHQGYKALFLVYFAAISLLLLLSFFTEISQLILPEQGTFESFDQTFRVCMILYFGHFIFFFLHHILLATHRAKSTYLITAIQNGVLLAGLYLCKWYGYVPSLFMFCLWCSALPLLVWVFSGKYYYHTIFKTFKPRLAKLIDKETKVLSGLNKDFFLIQLCTLVLYTTDNIVIVNFIGSFEVTIYHVTFKYFNILIILFNLVLLPYWASFTEAFGKGDRLWMKAHIRKLVLFWLGTSLLGVLMFSLSNLAFQFWIGKEVEVDPMLQVFMLISVLLTAWNSIFAYFLNSVSRTKGQMRLLLLAAVANIPLSIYLIDYFQTTGVILATCITLLPQAIFFPLEYRSVIQKMNNKDGI